LNEKDKLDAFSKALDTDDDHYFNSTMLIYVQAKDEAELTQIEEKLMNAASLKSIKLAENVYVSEVYDNAGNRITEPDGVATSFTVWVTPEEVESVNLAVVYGKVQIYLKTE
jgi:hypothetical protein